MDDNDNNNFIRPPDPITERQRLLHSPDREGDDDDHEIQLAIRSSREWYRNFMQRPVWIRNRIRDIFIEHDQELQLFKRRLSWALRYPEDVTMIETYEMVDSIIRQLESVKNNHAPTNDSVVSKEDIERIIRQLQRCHGKMSIMMDAVYKILVPLLQDLLALF